MSLLSVKNLTFAYDGSYDNIFENVSFHIDTDWKLGFTGRNGRGKTTFLNLLLGKHEYSGSITADVAFEYFPYEVANKQARTIDVLLSVCGDSPDWQIMRELSLLDVPEDALQRPFNTLSNGEQTKVLLCALFLKENSFLLIDEPTNHLDMDARAIVSNYLKSKKGFILVSHDRAFLDNCVDHILSINKTNIEIQRGNFSSLLTNKEKLDQFELAQSEKLKRDIKKLKQSAKQSEKWANRVESSKIGHGSNNVEKSFPNRAYIGEKSRRMQQRRKNLERRQSSAVEEKSNLLKNLETVDSLKISQPIYHSDRLVSLSDVSIFYGEKTVCKSVSFTIDRGERIALCGKNGSGKSSVINLICGAPIPHAGEVRVGSRLAISHVSQDTSFLEGGLSAFASASDIDESLFKAILRKLDFSRVQFEKDMRDFSGGQKKKVLIAKSLCEKAHLHIWDEPLNFIDIYSRMQIEELLKEHTPTILFVEHDRAFCDNIATKRVILG